MRAKETRGVAEYLAVFVLLGVVVGGSGLVYAAATRIAASSVSPNIDVLGGSMRAAGYFATETLTVYNRGASPVSSFSVATTEIPEGAEYCVSLVSPENMSALSTTCPTLSPDPSMVRVLRSIPPGGAVLVELFIRGASFAPGSWLSVTVVSSDGAEGTAGIQVVPA